jgi:hypothetical protein
MALRTKKLSAAQIGVAVESFVITLDGNQVVPVSAGARFRGDHPIVRQAPGFFVADGATSDEIGARRVELIREAEVDLREPPVHAPSAEPLKARDAVICIAAGPSYGKRFPRTDKDVKRHPDQTSSDAGR